MSARPLCRLRWWLTRRERARRRFERWRREHELPPNVTVVRIRNAVRQETAVSASILLDGRTYGGITGVSVEQSDDCGALRVGRSDFWREKVPRGETGAKRGLERL